MDLKLGISVWAAGVVVAVWAYVSNRRREGKAKKIADRVNEMPPRQVLKAYDTAIRREDPRIGVPHVLDYFELGRKLAAKGEEVCADCQHGIHGLPGEEGCACVCHARERVTA